MGFRIPVRFAFHLARHEADEGLKLSSSADLPSAYDCGGEIELARPPRRTLAGGFTLGAVRAARAKVSMPSREDLETRMLWNYQQAGNQFAFA